MHERSTDQQSKFVRDMRYASAGVLPGASRPCRAHGGGDPAAGLLQHGVAGAPAPGRRPRRGGAQVGAAAGARPRQRRHHRRESPSMLKHVTVVS